jgi:hypothetical protein
MTKTLLALQPLARSAVRNAPSLARTNAATAISRSLHRQVKTASMLLQAAKRFPDYDLTRGRLVKSSARVLTQAEAQLWQVSLEQAEVLSIASEVEELWFAIDAVS